MWPYCRSKLVNPFIYLLLSNNFSICYSGYLSTTRRHSQIRREDHGPSIFTCLAINVRQDIISGAAKWENMRTDHPVFVSPCWIVYHNTVRFSHNR